MASYTLETELREPVAEWLRRVDVTTIVGDELDFGWAAPDLVAASPARLEERLAQGVSPLRSMQQVALLESLRAPRARESLEAATSLRWTSYVRQVLEPLVDAGLVVRDAEGCWRLDEPLIDAFDELVAVELKLSDWRKAIAQGARYRTFASASYIAMPAARLSLGVIGQAARRHGVGVLAVKDGEVECLLLPPERPALDPRLKSQASELLLAAHLEPEGTRVTAGSPRGGARRVAAVPA